ncbi:LysR family transcriptional regulator [Streptomyces althioticus]|jgi:DNA-binding transcriptional LysR family regulator|uniref:LysR family transcriptional regulator n=1 Tax=Streptomyces althioticus group TaxID=2867194 RepID=UPI00177DD4F3|nr:LysR family transcriptional regulator [Streptomyces althioticus]WTB51137.1 LysR family transcriptional regulator [Streptomyces althioticus]WTB96647.1 LysR family transcriptional regulator [Streptomyces althioticus]GGQ95208.1 LysR family transcriptional regulator [Streptomyces griseorubens]
MNSRNADASGAASSRGESQHGGPSSDGAPSGGGPLDLGLLRTFLAVHRARSVTGAARDLGISQPTVSAQIQALEARMGRRLFERLPRGVAPTSVADSLAGEIAAPLDALASVAERGRPGAGVTAEPVHLAGPAELLAVLALPALAPLTDTGVLLRVTTGLADDLLEGLQAGRFDLVLSAVRPRGRTLSAVPLTDEEFVLVAAPEWARRIGPLTGGDPAPLRDVPLVAYAEDLPILRRYWRHVFRTRLAARPAVVVPDLRAVRSSVVAGSGVTVLPRYLCARELEAGALVALLSPEDPPINTSFLVQRAGGVPRAHVVAVRECLLRAAREW